MLRTPSPRTSRKSRSTAGSVLDRLRPDLLQLDRVVGDEAVAARDQLERELASFADRRRAGDDDADLEHARNTRVGASSPP
jgi:hypothetical protein